MSKPSKETDTEMQARLEQLEYALSVTSDGFWDWNLVTNELVLSDNWYASLGYRREEISQTISGWESLLHPDDLQPTWTALSQYFKGETTSYMFINRLRHADGTYRWNQDAGRIVERNDQGEPTRMIGIDRDISFQQALEQKLRQSQRLESIGRLIGGVAHDFNNILHPIMALAETATEKIDDKKYVKNALELIQASSVRAANLVSKLSKLSRHSEEELRPVVIGELSSSVLSMFESSVPRNVSLVVNITSSFSVMGDPANLEQILLNMCTNAVHSIGDHVGTLTVDVIDTIFDDSHYGSRGVLKTGEDVVAITVTDDGCGIPADIISSIFDPYFTTKHAGHGTGLGLSIVHGIVESCGGKITAESEVGHGSQFSIYLPKTQHHKGEQALEVMPRALAHCHVLLIDDDNTSLTVFAEGLELAGMVVTKSDSCEKAWELLSKRNRIDVVVSDLLLPNMCGDELSLLIKEAFPALPFIMMSGFGQKNREYKVDGWLSKPVNIVDVVYLIRSLLVTANEQG